MNHHQPTPLRPGGAGLLLSWQRFASGRWTVPAVTHAVANLLAVT
jgi:hypothetical protein